MFDRRLKYKWDNQNILDYARNEGKEEGILEGKIEGKVEGKLEEARDIAHEMKREGIPFTQISKFTKLPIEEIEKL